MVQPPFGQAQERGQGGSKQRPSNGYRLLATDHRIVRRRRGQNQSGEDSHIALTRLIGAAHCPQFWDAKNSTVGLPCICLRIPTGFRPIAQGCALRATLGKSLFERSTPTGLCPLLQSYFNSTTLVRPIPLHVLQPRTPFVRTQPRWGWDIQSIVSQGSAVRATLGYRTESRWDSRKIRFPRPISASQLCG
jgi:hypothetical protein